MEWQTTQQCDQHSDPMDCADSVVVEMEVGVFVLPIRTGESGEAGSYVQIFFCPWCGTRLSEGAEAIRRLYVGNW